MQFITGKPYPEFPSWPGFSKFIFLKRTVYIALATFICGCCSLSSQNTKGSWQWLGPKAVPAQVMGNIGALWADTSDLNFVLAGSAAGGLWQCSNAQSAAPAWKNLTDSYDSLCPGVSDIVVKPGTHRQTIYIGTKTATKDLAKAYGAGILRSTDGGQSWSRVGPQKSSVVDVLRMCPDAPEVMIAASGQELFITTNAWKDHKAVRLPSDNKDPNMQIADIEFAPYSNQVIYACTRSDKDKMAELWMSADQGASWTNITPSGTRATRIEAAVARRPGFANKLYMAYGVAEAYVRFYDGKTWSGNLNAAPVQHIYGGPYWNFEFMVSDKDTNVMYIAMTEVSKSVDGGRTFEKASYYNNTNTHADVRAMIAGRHSLKGEKDLVLMGNDGGISQSDEGVKNSSAWKNLNGSGLGVTQFWGLDVLQSDTVLIAAGAQDNSIFWYRDTAWKNNFNMCGDAYDAAVLSSNAFLIECDAPTILQNNFRSANYWSLALPDNYYKAFSRPLKSIRGKVYLGHRNLYEYSAKAIEQNDYKVKNKTNLDEYKDSEGNIENFCISAFDICERTMNSACVAFKNPLWGKSPNQHKLWYTSGFKADRPEWRDITPYAVYNNLQICEWSEIYELAVDDLKDELIYFISRDVFDQTNCRLFFMEFVADSGKWIVSDRTFNLPKVGLNKLLKEKDSDNLYVGTDAGVYYINRKLIGEQRWEKFNGSEGHKLPSCMITDLVINYELNRLYCSTYGRGIWQGTLASDLADDFIYKKNTVINETVSVDGKMTIAKNVTLELGAKLFLSKGSVIELKKGSRLVVKKGNILDYEGNRTYLKNYLKAAAGATVVYK